MIGRTFFSSSAPSSSPEGGSPAPVWIVDDNEPQRQRLVELIDGQIGLECALACSTGEDAVAALDQNAVPQVVLMALELPGMTGIEAI